MKAAQHGHGGQSVALPLRSRTNTQASSLSKVSKHSKQMVQSATNTASSLLAISEKSEAADAAHAIAADHSQTEVASSYHQDISAAGQGRTHEVEDSHPANPGDHHIGKPALTTQSTHQDDAGVRGNRHVRSDHAPRHSALRSSIDHSRARTISSHAVSAATTGSAVAAGHATSATATGIEASQFGGTDGSNGSLNDEANVHERQPTDEAVHAHPEVDAAKEATAQPSHIIPGPKCLHKYQREDIVQERSMAFSLQKLAQTNGALGHLADFLAHSSLNSAAGAKMSGSQKEAFKELTKILKKWREHGSADKTLSEVAKQLPSLDVIGYGLLMNAGEFAKALHCISTIRSIDVAAKSVAIIFKPELQMPHIVNMQAEGFQIEPRLHEPFISAGLFDMFQNVVDVDSNGIRRNVRKRGCFWPQPGHDASKDDILKIINEVLAGYVQRQLQLEQLPTAVVLQSTATANSWLQQYRRAHPLARQYLPIPKEITVPNAAVVEAVKQALASAKAVHRPLRRPVVVPPDERPTLSSRRGVPEAAASLSCISFLGCLAIGTNTGVLGCILGCIAGLGQIQRTVRRRAVPALNEWNAEAYEQATMSPEESMATDADAVAAITRETDGRRSSTNGNGTAVRQHPTNDDVRQTFQTDVTTRTSAESAAGTQPRKLPAEDHECGGGSRKDGAPIGVVFEIPRAFVAPVAKLLREHLLFEVLRRQRPLRGLLLQCIEASLLSCIAGLMMPRGQPLPLIVAVDVPEVELEAGETSIHSPRFTCMLILELRMAYRGPNISKLHIAVTDENLDKVFSVVSSQLPDLDLRLVDPRLSGFMQPVGIEGSINLSWIQCDVPRLELQDMKLHFELPSY